MKLIVTGLVLMIAVPLICLFLTITGMVDVFDQVANEEDSYNLTAQKIDFNDSVLITMFALPVGFIGFCITVIGVLFYIKNRKPIEFGGG